MVALSVYISINICIYIYICICGGRRQHSVYTKYAKHRRGKQHLNSVVLVGKLGALAICFDLLLTFIFKFISLDWIALVSNKRCFGGPRGVSFWILRFVEQVSTQTKKHNMTTTFWKRLYRTNYDIRICVNSENVLARPRPFWCPASPPPGPTTII